jgi:hypothetical protein
MLLKKLINYQITNVIQYQTSSMASVYSELETCCRTGDLCRLKTIWKKNKILWWNKIDLTHDSYHLILTATRHNHLPVIEWLFNHQRPPKSIIDKLFILSCRLNFPKPAAFFRQHINISEIDERILETGNSITMIEYCCKNNYIDILRIIDDPDRTRIVCYAIGNVELFKTLYPNFISTDPEPDSNIYCNMCYHLSYKHFNPQKYCLKYGFSCNECKNHYRPHDDSHLFYRACRNGHLDAAQSIEITDRKILTNGMVEAIVHNQPDIYRWLQSIGINVDNNSLYLFNRCLKHNNIDSIKWLESIYSWNWKPIRVISHHIEDRLIRENNSRNIYIDFEDQVIHAFHNNCNDVGKWLIDHFDGTVSDQGVGTLLRSDNMILIEYIISKNIQILISPTRNNCTQLMSVYRSLMIHNDYHMLELLHNKCKGLKMVAIEDPTPLYHKSIAWNTKWSLLFLIKYFPITSRLKYPPDADIPSYEIRKILFDHNLIDFSEFDTELKNELYQQISTDKTEIVDQLNQHLIPDICELIYRYV